MNHANEVEMNRTGFHPANTPANRNAAAALACTSLSRTSRGHARMPYAGVNVGAIQARALCVDEVRMERVLALREAIVAGTYCVAAGDVADRLIGLMLR